MAASASEIIREVSQGPSFTADVSSDLLLMHTLKRKSVAYDLAGVISCETHEVLVKFLTRAYMRPTCRPEQGATWD